MEGLNLLPWREQQRENRKRQFAATIAAVILSGILFIIFSHVLIERKIQEQEAVSNFLQTEIKSLNQSLSEVKRLKQRKQAMIQRLEFINKLQAGRPLVVGTYDELVRIIPQGVYINTISRKGSILIMEGHSESNAQISELMRNAEHSKWFSEPKLQEIKTGNKQKNYKYAFSLKLTLEPRSASKYIRHTVTETKAKQQ